jgi:hypothetical protein
MADSNQGSPENSQAVSLAKIDIAFERWVGPHDPK